MFYNVWSESTKSFLLGQSVLTKKQAEIALRIFKKYLVSCNEERVNQGHTPLIDDYVIVRTEKEWMLEPGIVRRLKIQTTCN